MFRTMALDLRISLSNPTLVLPNSPSHRCSSSRSNSSLPPCSPCTWFPVTRQNKITILSQKFPPKFSKRGSFSWVAKSSGSSSSSETSTDGSKSPTEEKIPFGYTRKDVLLIGLGVTVIGVGLKSGLEFVGIDPLKAGNVVQLVMVLGLTVGWISTYIFRVSNKDMTYTQQLKDYENKVMEKRLESLSEAELEALLEQVEEEKGRLTSDEQFLK
ncbi:uncharacterized protein LOC109718636 [Ananas comosus]|uniref:Uncharacterized protein LOC109718636 n=2 Tax=Ananas comosus TaxID=4615 RepID=A0A6P5FW61_ANACO|nr:uncharacterized protein LOC109718636 [Ananas comosus]CAD1822000.1 unnamed protein product [Ananas comosus var. bracteatus]